MAALAAALLAFVAIAGPALAVPLNGNTFGELARRCGPSVAPSTLASIGQTESGLQPLAINDNTTGVSGVPATRDMALQIATRLLQAGHSVDLGIMQINAANFGSVGLTVESAFDPCKSIAAAAVILEGGYAGGDTHAAQQAALRVALSRYNTGDAARGFENGYVHKVELAAQHIVPALDVPGSPGVIDRRMPLSPPAPAVPKDPNAPPSWDVWSSFDYAATHPEHGTPQLARAGSATLADAGTGPAAAAMDIGPSTER